MITKRAAACSQMDFAAIRRYAWHERRIANLRFAIPPLVEFEKQGVVVIHAMAVGKLDNVANLRRDSAFPLLFDGFDHRIDVINVYLRHRVAVAIVRVDSRKRFNRIHKVPPSGSQ